jgi:hypothetical protein
MIRIVSLLAGLLLFCQISRSQNAQIPGKPVGEIYADFHYSINDSTRTTGFSINRAHLGYRFEPGGKITSTIIVNIGIPESLTPGATLRRYAIIREASVTYTEGKLKIAFGMVNTRIFDFQQQFWGKRYLGPEYQYLYGYGSVADVGIVVDYRLTDIIKIDFSLLNGEGYSNIQLDNSLRTALGITMITPQRLYFKLYSDFMKPENILQSAFIGFAGLKRKFFSFGGEASFKTNADKKDGHNVWGLAATGGINVTEKTELFTRYDYFTSYTEGGNSGPWNPFDGRIAKYGVQYKFNNYLRMALNYQGYYPNDKTIPRNDMIYLNANFNF